MLTMEPAGARRLCKNCGRKNSRRRELCWACYRKLRDEQLIEVAPYESHGGPRISLEISKIRRDGGTQARVALSDDHVADLVHVLREGKKFLAPLVVFHDGRDYWLGDGFHRVEASEQQGRTEILAEVLAGDRRDAILFACGANSMHGLKRTNADKRLAVTMLLRDPEWSKWSNREIARQCGVSGTMVDTVRGEMTANGLQSTTRIGGDGRTIDTANIGRRGESESSAPPSREDPIDVLIRGCDDIQRRFGALFDRVFDAIRDGDDKARGIDAIARTAQFLTDRARTLSMEAAG